MKMFLTLLRFFIAPVFFCSVVGVAAQTVSIGNKGNISIPEEYTHQMTGITDSVMGEIRRKNSSFIIYYDIGAMAGTHMHKGKKAECVWFTEKVFRSGLEAFIGLINNEGKKKLVVTIPGDLKHPFDFPANFWAEVKNLKDENDLLQIASSYFPNNLSQKEEYGDEKRATLWKALMKAWGKKFGNEQIKIDVYAENSQMTEVCFRSKNQTFIFNLKNEQIESALHAKALPPINSITYWESPKGDSAVYIFWYYGQRELTIPAERRSSDITNDLLKKKELKPE